VPRSSLSKKVFITVIAAAVMLGCFALGFVSCLHLKSAPSAAMRAEELTTPGDASPAVRSGVLASLHAFQDGYVQRNPAAIDAFMGRLFPRDQDILALGTEGGTFEWIRGYDRTAQFIKADWQGWGDFRFDVDRSLIWSSGDVAWVASLGSVGSGSHARPVRFTAILTRDGDRWLFRQVHFQWDDENAHDRDVLNPRTYARMVRNALR
jgi:hypothetical protein